MKMVTSSQVARRARVGRSTVSLVLNNHGETVGISAATQRRVRRAAQRMGYTPSFAGRALRRGRTKTIGLLLSAEAIHDLPIDPGSVLNMAAHVEAACAYRGYSLTILRHAGGDEGALLDRIASGSVDGLILTGWATPAVTRVCQRQEIACVDIWGTLGTQPVCAVEADLASARVEAIRYAAGLGHRHAAIACQAQPRQHELNRQVLRRVADDETISNCRVEAIDLPGSDLEMNPGAWLAKAWIASPAAQRATVIMAHERTCVGFVGALPSHGLDCPRDVSVISLADAGLAELVTPAITSIDVSFRLACETGTRFLIDRIESGRPPSAADSPPMLPCGITIRQSVAPPPTAFHAQPSLQEN